MVETSTDEQQDDWEDRFYRTFPTLDNLLDFRNAQVVGFKMATVLKDFIRTELQRARDERTKEIVQTIGSYASYLRPIEGNMMHNMAVEYLKQFRGEEINQQEE